MKYKSANHWRLNSSKDYNVNSRNAVIAKYTLAYFFINYIEIAVREPYQLIRFV